MARDTVVIDGVTLTRKQIEEAHAKLHEGDTAKPGDVFADEIGGSIRTWFIAEPGSSDGPDDVRWFYGRTGHCVGNGQERTPHIELVGNLDTIVAFYRQHHPEAK